MTISHALIVLDFSILSHLEEIKGHLTISHPVLSHKSWIPFQLEFFKSFLNRYFLIAYFDYKLSNHINDYMTEGYLLSDNKSVVTEKYNEEKYTYFENIIKKDPSKFYTNKKMLKFYKRDSVQKFSLKVIYESQYKMLKEISEILKKNKTEIKVIISPLYDQLKFDKSDYEILCDIFGKQNVFDFSGINFITNDYHNYYENSHYRPHVADYIMKEIYK